MARKMCMSKPKAPSYSAPPAPAPEPIIERQAYKDPTPRSALATDDTERRRRMIMGVMTSPRGVGIPASTTKPKQAAAVGGY